MSTKHINSIDNAIEWLVETGAPPKIITELQEIVRLLEWEYRYGGSKTPRSESS